MVRRLPPIPALLLTIGAISPAVRAAAEAQSAPATRPVPAIRHAVIISCDGLRPDVLLRADAPNVRKLMARGSFSFWARTVPIAITLPSHASMLTGVSPERHGIHWNDDQPDAGYPKVPTLFEVAKKAGYTTAIAAGKQKFTTLAKPGSVDWASIRNAPDADVAKQAAAMIAEHKPGVLFVHLPGADRAGHGIGWGSKEQLAVVAAIDASFGKVIQAIDDAKLTDSTVVILSADHGGAGRNHGGMTNGKATDDPRSRHIPWICAGPGIRQGFDLTEDPSLTLNTVDTYATVCFLMAIPPGDVEGKPVRQMLVEQGELLHAAGQK
jgi:predicted AlkP superfamily pyrophosphatase or phosphodiesterase